MSATTRAFDRFRSPVTARATCGTVTVTESGTGGTDGSGGGGDPDVQLPGGQTGLLAGAGAFLLLLVVALAA